MLVVGRVLGELMLRIHQPEVLGRLVAVRRTPEPAILSQIRKGKHNLLVLGATVRPGEGLFLRTQDRGTAAKNAVFIVGGEFVKSALRLCVFAGNCFDFVCAINGT